MRNDLRVPSVRVSAAITENDFKEAKRICKQFFGERYFSQFVREALRRYVEYWKSHEEAANTKRFYCDLDTKVYESLTQFCQDKDAQLGEVASLLLSEKLYEMGVCDDNYFIPDMNNLV